MSRSRRLLAALIAVLGLALFGCSEGVYRVVIPFLYVESALPADRIVRDVTYRAGAEADASKHRLDLFLAEGTGWPVLVFVHGGGWTSGDRALRVGGADVYANIGRFFASHGVGAAVISYRLQPGVQWQDQVDDVAAAVAWVHGEIDHYGGRPDAIFVAGHSAGAQLVTRVALDREPLRRFGVEADTICGLVPVSGAAFDLADEETYALGEQWTYYQERFRGDDPTNAWEEAASPLRFASPDAPPTLVLYGGHDSAGLQRQSRLLDRALRAQGAKSEVVVIPRASHERMVLALSRADEAGSLVLDFVRRTVSMRCPAPSGS